MAPGDLLRERVIIVGVTMAPLAKQLRTKVTGKSYGDTVFQEFRLVSFLVGQN